jgi:hypothetical protein
MPPVVIAGAIAGVGAVGAAAISSSAASKASKAASNATAANNQLEREQYQQTRADLQPAVSAGNTARDALMQRLGLSGPAAAPAATTAAPASVKTGMSTSPLMPAAGANPSPAAPAQGAPEMTSQQAQAILADRPDVAGSAWLNGIDPSVIGDRTGDGKVTQDDRAAYWEANYGSKEGYTPPTVSAPAPAASTPSTVPGQTLTSSDNGGLGARPQVSRPTYSEAQPGQVDLSAQSFEASPFYNLGLADTMRNVNASYGARGLLKSGAGLKGATDAASANFMQNYGNWANQQLGIWNTNLGQYNANRNVFNQNYNTDTGRNDNIFNSDRAYNTDQYNNYTGNLFSLAGSGQNAAAGQATANQNYASQTAANNNSNASVQGNAAIAQANGINNAISSGIQAYGAYSNSNPFGSGGSAASTGGAYGFTPNPYGLY